MKKVLLTSLGVMVALAMVLTACQDPTDFTNTNYEGKVINELEAPQNVTAWAYAPTGYIRVAWDKVPNATGYEIYRRTELNGKTTVKFLQQIDNAYSAGGVDLFYEDIIDFDNEDITGNVTYKVVAYSDWSSNPKAAGKTLPWSGTESDWFLLQNSAADSNRVSLSGAPAPGSAIAKPTNLKVSKVTTYAVGVAPSSVVQLTWDAVPGVDYFINYGVGGGELDKAPITQTFWTQAVATTTYQKTGAAIIPLLGKTSIELVAQHQSTSSAVYGAAKYYGASEPATASEEGPAPATFGAPTNLSATPLGSKLVQLTWKKALGATGYKVYRFIASANGYLGNGGVVYEEWKDITAGLTIFNADGFDNLSAIDNLTTLYDGDGGVNGYPEKNLIYVVIATGPNNTVSVPSNVSYAGPNQVNAQTLTATVLSSDASYTLLDGWKGIRLNWPTEPYSGNTHKLYRAEVTWDGYAVVAEGEYAEVVAEVDAPNTVADGNIYNNYGLIDYPSVRKSWRYRLDTIAADGTVINSDYETVRTYPYVNQVNISVNMASIPTLDPNNTGTVTTRRSAYLNAYNIATTATQVQRIKSLLLDGEEVKIYKVQTDVSGNIIGNYEEITPPIAKNDVSTRVYVENNPAGYWKYFALVETTTVRNLANASNPTATITTADEAVWTVIDGTTLNTKLVEVTGDNGIGDYLNNLQVVAVITSGTGSSVTAAETARDTPSDPNHSFVEKPLQLSRYNTSSDPQSDVYRTNLLGQQIGSGSTYWAHKIEIFYIAGNGERTTVASVTATVTTP